MASRAPAADAEAPLLASTGDGAQAAAPTTTTVIGKALNSTADLAKHLPTGAVLAFEMLSPTFTADGTCDAANRALTGCLIGACALCCFALCFTDSYRDPATGALRYGFVTPSGRLLPIDGSSTPVRDDDRYRLTVRDVMHGLLSFAVFLRLLPIDGSSTPVRDDDRYRLTVRDVMHGLLSFAVFLAVAMVDRNVVACFYPVESASTRQLMAAVPAAAGAVGSFLFAMFPSTRRGVGFPVAASSS